MPVRKRTPYSGSGRGISSHLGWSFWGGCEERMLRNPWIEGTNSGGYHKEDKVHEDDSTSSSAYEIVEEEVVETLSDYGGDDYLGTFDVDEVEVEEEIFDEAAPRLAGICEEEYEEDDDVTEVSVYEDRSVFTECQSDLGSVTEVEVDDMAEIEAIYNAMLQEEEDEEVTVADEDSEVEEVTLHDDDEAAFEAMFSSNFQITEASKSPSFERKVPSRNDSMASDCDQEEEEASAEEFREAIDYILRQERAVARMILTEEQADKMLHLPPRVMKIIVDHMEVCDNANSPIDWDFLLKIVTPFCGPDNDDSSGDDEDAQAVSCSCGIAHKGLFCPEITR